MLPEHKTASRPSTPKREASTHGWSLVDEARKRELIDAIASGGESPGPVHAELDLTDRCNVACYFCNQQLVRTKEHLPFEEAEALIEELVAGGLRSVRLSGGGDPLMYPEMPRVLDCLADRGVVVDNLTTNGALLGPEIAERLVAGAAREVIFSLNATDADDYHRMMRVAPKVFEQVLANVRGLIALRGDRPSPAVTVQFLIDGENYRRLPEMVALGDSLGVDRIAVSPVLEIARGLLAERPLLQPADRELVRPYLRRALELENDREILDLGFPWQPWNEMVWELRAALGHPQAALHPPAGSFRPDLDFCFFGWYSAAVRGTGETYPCCMLISPDYEPLGNVREDGFEGVWRGEGFETLRSEMREVFLTRGRVETDELSALRPQCVEAGRCGLKSMYFRGDEAFYRELGDAVDAARQREVRFLGGPERLRRALRVFRYRVRWGLRTRRTRLLEAWQRLERRRLPRLLRGARLHFGPRPRPRLGALEGWVRLGLPGSTWADRVIDPSAPLPVRRARAIHAERILETLEPDEVRAFLRRCREALARDGVLRVAAVDPGPEPVPAVGGSAPRARWSPERLETELRHAGFAAVSAAEWGRSERSWLRGLEDHPVVEGESVFVLEALAEAPGAHP